MKRVIETAVLDFLDSHLKMLIPARVNQAVKFRGAGETESLALV